MIRQLSAILITVLFSGAAYTQTEFAIVGESGQKLHDTITIISGMSLNLGTNFSQLRGDEVGFDRIDRTSEQGPFPIGFIFRFYDGNFSEFHVGSNGYITFESQPYNPATELINIPFATPDPRYPINSIFGCFKRWNPIGGKYVSIHREIMNQSVIITWCKTPAQVSSAQGLVLPTGTFQIVIYASGIIEIHLIDIQESTFQGNLSATGIQGSTTTGGIAAPGRNWGVSWAPVSEESWRFEPDLSFSNYEVTSIPFAPVNVPESVGWFELLDTFGNEQEIGSDFQVLVEPKQFATYRTILYSCWGEEIASDTVTVNVAGIFPRVFNPNSLPPNNAFKMVIEPGIPVSDFRLQIYNRWGQLIFETTDPYTGWNGRTNNTGSDCPMDVYNWTLMFERDGKNKISNSGSVLLLR